MGKRQGHVVVCGSELHPHGDIDRYKVQHRGLSWLCFLFGTWKAEKKKENHKKHIHIDARFVYSF